VTGSGPTSSPAITFAASRIVVERSTVVGFDVITSRI
jgi:hypothetical protein